MNTYNLQRRIATSLLEIGAVTFRPSSPFRWSSGLYAPVYCDNRLSLSHVVVRGMVIDALVAEASELLGNLDVVAGTATAGIPYATLLADRLELPLVYVRGERKQHGQQNRVEGEFKKGDNVLLIEDLVSTGGSVLSAAQALRDEGANVETVFSVVTYGLDTSEKAFQEMDIELRSVLSFTTLLKSAQEEGFISREEAADIEGWHKNPAAWSRQAEEAIPSN